MSLGVECATKLPWLRLELVQRESLQVRHALAKELAAYRGLCQIAYPHADLLIPAVCMHPCIDPVREAARSVFPSECRKLFLLGQLRFLKFLVERFQGTRFAFSIAML